MLLLLPWPQHGLLYACMGLYTRPLLQTAFVEHWNCKRRSLLLTGELEPGANGQKQKEGVCCLWNTRVAHLCWQHTLRKG
jgi:hypothetical protein